MVKRNEAQQLIASLNTLDRTLHQLTGVLGIMGGLEQATRYQSSFLRLNMLASEQMNTALVNTAPRITSLQTQIELLDGGLENNTEGLSEYIARAKLFNENTEELIKGLRSLRLNLGLSINAETELARTIFDSAKSYSVASERLVESFVKFSSTLAIFSYQGNQDFLNSMAEVMAMTDRRVPGGLQTVLEPILGAGPEGFARAAMLGIEDELQRIQGGDFDSKTIISMLKSIDENSEMFQNLDFRISNPLLRNLFGMSAATLNINKNLLAAVEESLQKDGTLIASIQDTKASIENLQQLLYDPIASTLVGIISAAENIATSVSPETLQKIFASAVGIAFTLLGAKLLQVVYGSLFGGSLIRGLGLAVLGALGGIGFPELIRSSSKTADNTRDIKKALGKGETELTPAELIDRMHGSTLSKLINENSKYTMADRLSTEAAQMQRERLITKMGELLDEMRRQTRTKEMKPTNFRNAK